MNISKDDLFLTSEGNQVESFDIYNQTISGITIDGQEVSLAYTRDFAFRGNVGKREIYNLERPAYLRDSRMTQDELYGTLDAAVSFAYAYDEHERRHGCDDAPSCPNFG